MSPSPKYTTGKKLQSNESIILTLIPYCIMLYIEVKQTLRVVYKIYKNLGANTLHNPIPCQIQEVSVPRALSIRVVAVSVGTHVISM